MLDPQHRFYQDLPPAEQDHWSSELRPHPAVAQLTPIDNLGYKYVSTTYLLCENDQGLPVQVQRDMVKAVEEDSFGGKIELLSCESGHSPFLSMPDRVVEVLEGFVPT
jgi:hypothetical protein